MANASQHHRDLTCLECLRSFKRREHLDRHMQSHSGSKSYSCAFCFKKFSRKDSLQRHVRVHGTNAGQPLTVSRSARACQLCAREKRRCSGEFPCLRCQEKNRECHFRNAVYPRLGSPSYSRRSSVTGVQVTTPLSVIEENTSPITGRGRAPDIAFVTPRNNQHSVKSSTPSISLPPGEVENEIAASAPSPNLGLDWEMQDNQAYNLSFSLPDIGSLFSWMPQNDQFSSPTSQNSIPPEIDIPPPQTTTIGTTHTAHSRILDPRASQRKILSLFPQLQPSDCNVLNIENSAHVSPIPVPVYQQILSFFREQQAAGFPCYSFPEKSVLDTFIQLYFEHFDPLMPFVHCSFLDTDDVHWILVLAVASLGSQYTAIERRSQYIIALLEALGRALPNDASTVLNYDMTIIAQSALLYNISLMSCGYRDYICILETQRAWLATLIQPLMSQSSSNSFLCQTPYPTPQEGPSDWQNWLRIEGQRRLVYCAWLFDCMAAAFMDSETKLQLEDLDLQLPYDDQAWRTRTVPETDARCYSQTCADQNAPVPNLRMLFIEFCSSDIDITWHSEFTKLLLLFTFWVEERRAVKGSKALLLMHGDKTVTKSRSASDEHLDAKFSQLQVANPETVRLKLVDQHILRLRKSLYHVLFILRLVPFKMLNSSCGWRTSSPVADKNRRSIVQWMQDNPKSARHCVFHAAAAFCQMRRADTCQFYQPFSVLAAVQYLSFYQHKHIHNPQSTIPDGREVAHSTQRPSSGPSQSIDRVVRISPYQTDQDDLISQWISGKEPGLTLYLPGVGLLLKPLSRVCLLQEFQRLLISRELIGWPILRAAIRHNTEEFLSQIAPLSQPPYSFDAEE